MEDYRYIKREIVRISCIKHSAEQNYNYPIYISINGDGNAPYYTQDSAEVKAAIKQRNASLDATIAEAEAQIEALKKELNSFKWVISYHSFKPSLNGLNCPWKQCGRRSYIWLQPIDSWTNPSNDGSRRVDNEDEIYFKTRKEALDYMYNKHK